MQLRDVVAPVSMKTFVDLGPPTDGQLSIQAGGFQGEVALVEEPERISLLVVPAPGSAASTIRVRNNGQDTHLVSVFPVWTTQEETSIDSHASPLDPTQRDYLIVTQSIAQAARQFNGAPRTPRRMVVAGHTVVIEPQGEQGIVEMLRPGNKPALDLESLEIHAERVVIAASLALPGTDVSIFARSLVFADQGAEKARIDTTPQAMTKQTDAGTAGLDGEPAGKVCLYIAKIEEAAPPLPRFNLVGGTGQEGGPPTPGSNGANLPMLASEPQIGGIVRSWRNIMKEVHGELTADWQVYKTPKNVVWFQRYGKMELGKRDTWPGDGAKGKPGGVPGVGGKGGDLRSTITVRKNLAVCDGGKSGPAQGPAVGGHGGLPAHAIGIWIENRLTKTPQTHCHHEDCIEESVDVPMNVYNFYSRKSKNGADITSPAAPAPTGKPGQVRVDLKGWLHSSAAQMVLAYAEDCYRLGFMSQATRELERLQKDMLDPLNLAQDFAKFALVSQRVNALLARLSSNLDFFGNPAGWVPALDLAALYQLLEIEVREIGPMIVATERIRKAAEKGTATVAALQQSRDKTAAELLKLKSSVNKFAASLPFLRVEAEAVARDETALLEAIIAEEQRLLEHAHDLAKPKASFLKQALRTIGAVAVVCPIGQPVVGAVGAGLDILTSIDEGTPWDQIRNIPSVARGFSKENIAESIGSYQKFIAGASAIDLHDPKQLYAKISVASDAIGKTLAHLRQQQEASRVPATRVEEILQKLRSEDPTLNNLVAGASDLTARKLVLSQTLDAAIYELGEATSQISALTQRLDALNVQLINTQAQVGHPAISAANDLARQFRERLDLNHYQFIKAYEYYTASPFDGDRRAAGTAQSVATFLANSGNNEVVAAEAYQAAYVAVVRAAATRIVQRLAALGGGTQKSILIVLTTDEIAQLNRMLSDPSAGGSRDLFIALEDRGLIPSTDLEARLVQVEVETFEYSGQSAGSISVGVEIDAGSRGVIRSEKCSLAFRHERDAHIWGATVDLTTNPPTITPHQTPKDIAKLLGSVLGLSVKNEYTTAPPLFPGLWMGVSKQAEQPAQIEIGKLHLRLTYSCRPSSDVRAVRVIAHDIRGVKPLFYVSSADISGAQHAIGSFTRFFGGSFPIQIVAQTMVGLRPFGGWYRQGTLIEVSNQLALPVTDGSFQYEARYL